MNILSSTYCERCGKSCGSGFDNSYIMSMFNRQEICSECKRMEIRHPSYIKAANIENDECKKKNFNYKGVGIEEGVMPRIIYFRLDILLKVMNIDYSNPKHVEYYLKKCSDALEDNHPAKSFFRLITIQLGSYGAISMAWIDSMNICFKENNINIIEYDTQSQHVILEQDGKKYKIPCLSNSAYTDTLIADSNPSPDVYLKIDEMISLGE